MKVLPDTSVWVDYLQQGAKGGAWPLDDLLRTDSILVCGPVVAELLAGAKKVDRDELWSLLRPQPWAPLGRKEWHQVGELAAVLRERGLSIPLTDIEIAVSALSASAALWSYDSDFEQVTAALPGLQRYQP